MMLAGRNGIWIAMALIGVSLLAGARPAKAATVEEFVARLDAGEAIRIIDIRSRSQYAAAHIPGAISVRASIIERKRFPELGAVIVYGDGLNPDVTRDAVDALNAKPGIEADALVGGFAAWEARGHQDTGESGLSNPSVPSISYQKLVSLAEAESDVVLIDLRSGKDHRDLEENFGELPIVSMPMEHRAGGDSKRRTPATGPQWQNLDPDKLYVLIDDGSGSDADRMALRLAGHGIKRVAILAGGEETIQRRGVSESVTRSHTKTIAVDGGHE